MLLFEGPPGRVARLEEPAVAGVVSMVDLPADDGPGDPRITYETRRSIITRVVLAANANVQFLHTMGSHVYIYVFGDRVGTLGLAGLSFANECPGVEGNGGGQGHGGEHMIRWFRENRVSKRRRPVRVMIGEEAMEGFATQFQYDVVEPQTLLVQWNIGMISLPET